MESKDTLGLKSVRAVLVAVMAILLPAVALAGQQQQGVEGEHLVKRLVKAVGYEVGGGGTRVDLISTQLLPGVSGEARIEAKKGVTDIQATVQGLTSPGTLGSEFLTYVLWAASPDGRTINLGEIQPSKSGNGEIKATTQMQTFSLFITAEPYFAVTHPSELIVLENETRKSTKGKIFEVKDYPLLERSQYEKLGNPLALSPDLKHVPLEMYEARNSVDISKSSGAEKYAPEIFTKAENSLKISENLLARKAGKKEIISAARQTVQFSEDARSLAVKRQEAERIEQERQAAAARATAQAEAKAAAEAAEARRRADEEAQRQSELAAAREAQLKAEADATRAREQAAQAEAEAMKAKEQAAREDAERARKVAEALRAQLLDQLNAVLETRDTPRGLVVTMADVLFATGKYNLRAEARERLARLSGIVSSHPGLNLQVEGHTDSVGSDEFNQKLSEQRAQAVRSYLITQGLDQNTISAVGLGKTMPIADNSTAEGRQKNRRVEIIVSGEVIGTKFGK
ncbi:MAG: OmpA family protein [Acidobacteria bacterium]|nr:MAG: OmpA family protein [Acidobacteriota bacterium]